MLPVGFSNMQSTLLLQVTSYAIESAQQRGRLFCASGDEVYEGQVVGIHQRAGDLRVNVCKRKAANNIRRWAARCCVSLAAGAFTPFLGEEPCTSPMRRRQAASTICRCCCPPERGQPCSKPGLVLLHHARAAGDSVFLVQTASSLLCMIQPATPLQPVLQGCVEQCLACGTLKISRTEAFILPAAVPPRSRQLASMSQSS